MDFVSALSTATLTDLVAKFGMQAQEHLHNPPHQPLQIDNTGHRHSILIYLTTEHSSEDAYEKICRSTAWNFSGAPGIEDLLSFYKVESLITELTGIEKIQHDMCFNSCTAFTGPYSKLKESGWDYLRAVLNGDIKKDDIVLMVSLDSTQLYASKQSDCWIYIWVILNLSLDKQYKKVHICPGGFIPGPNKPKNINSFLFIGLHHIAALQHEGLRIWDASKDCVFQSDLYLLFTTADGPGLVCWDGMVRHSGKNSCHLYCPMPGRCKGTHYYPALLRPQGNHIAGSDHPDIDVFRLPLSGSGDYAHNLKCLVSSLSQQQWDLHKMETGITKLPLILGLERSQSLRVPLCMTTDLMHLTGNLSDLLISLWHSTMECSHMDDKNSWDWAVLHDEDTWTAHGKRVENAGMFIPGSFDCKPCNITDKINMDYKTWEFHLYIFSLTPVLLYSILPECYWINFCKLVHGIQIMSQHAINKQDLEHTYVLLCSWGHEFELIYYSLRQDWLHFIHPCVHQVLHLVTKTMHKGPLICYAQWMMERTIGNLGQEIRQPSKPYENLAEEGVRRSRVNALLAIMLELDDGIKGNPMGSIDLGEGGQIVQSLWQEKLKTSTQIHISRNVKFTYDGRKQFGEVQYFARVAMDANDGDADEAWKFEDVAVIHLYSLPDDSLLKLSSHMLVSSMFSDEVVVV
ncbi:hypothetical protein SCLCIDRAFT_28084 [Scleroderma citrinum Foug A]|uniref:Uncharacterized protein n=1 Tax=Scleroderma citrinum Foug A TaxID=1036808 RepID=A0A0C3DCG8_9AGAM|nr:hypothetical protein SCLCIDRAFT_28084 [Scleroderma citrinum Foug A]